MTHTASTRLQGLDTLRAAAIGLVYMYHYTVFASHAPTFGVLSQVGWIGVDLFFALSGYLIGNQILRAMQSEAGFSIKTFYARRFLRTLPNYYAVLALFVFVPLVRAGAVLPPVWKFLTFTQNINLQIGTAFSHAWSLCVEEQFYLILPAVALLVATRKHAVRLGWVLVLATVLGGMLLRTGLWPQTVVDGEVDWGRYYALIYYSPFCRFDELLAGVVVAMVANFHPAAWARLTRHGYLTLLAGLLGVSAVAYSFVVADSSRGFATFGYPVLAFSFALLVVSALSPNSPLARIRVPGAATLAVWSYAIYLVHKPIIIVGAKLLKPMQIAAGSGGGVAILTVASVLGGALLYFCVERPFLRLRDRRVQHGQAALAVQTAA